jgi:hypothetical protein
MSHASSRLPEASRLGAKSGRARSPTRLDQLGAESTRMTYKPVARRGQHGEAEVGLAATACGPLAWMTRLAKASGLRFRIRL